MILAGSVEPGKLARDVSEPNFRSLVVDRAGGVGGIVFDVQRFEVSSGALVLSGDHGAGCVCGGVDAGGWRGGGVSSVECVFQHRPDRGAGFQPDDPEHRDDEREHFHSNKPGEPVAGLQAVVGFHSGDVCRVCDRDADVAGDSGVHHPGVVSEPDYDVCVCVLEEQPSGWRAAAGGAGWG